MIDELIQEQETAIRETMLAEKPAEGIFYAAKLHTLRQDKLILQTRRDLRRVRLRRLQIGNEEV